MIINVTNVIIHARHALGIRINIVSLARKDFIRVMGNVLKIAPLILKLQLLIIKMYARIKTLLMNVRVHVKDVHPRFLIVSLVTSQLERIL